MVFAQDLTISGKVTSAEDGSSVPGVNVVVAGTTTGAVTDIDGNYKVTVPSDGATLVFSFIGMVTQEVEIGSRSVINITMALDYEELSEVIVTAYGTSTVKAFTGSATAINSKDIELRQVTSPIAAIEGNSTGVQFITPSGAPGESPNIIIRGVGTLNGGTDTDSQGAPLYIVDGVQFEGDLTLINQDDIKSMTVLKDAASSALYGSRAANGVVIITTKKGIKGQPTSVNYSGQYGWMSPAIDEYEVTSPQQYYEVMWEAYKNSLDPADYPNATYPTAEADASGTIYNRLGYNPFNVANDDIVDTNGNINPSAQVVYPGLDWYDALQRQGTRTNHNLTVGGGSDKASLFFSTGYLKEKGYVIETEFERVSMRLNADIAANDWLTIGSNMYLTMSDRKGVGSAGSGSIVNPFGFAKNMGAVYPVYLVDDATKQIVLDAAGNKIYDRGEGYTAYGISPRPQSPGRHAIEEAILNDIFDSRNAYGFRAHAKVDLPWVEGLGIKATYARDYQDRVLKDYENAEVGDGQPTARYAETRSRRLVENFNQLITYEKTIGGFHNIDVTLGHESYDRSYTSNNGFATTQVAEGIFEFDNFSVPIRVGGSTTNKTLEGYFARLNYDYKNKYYISLSGRRDGSSVFNKDVRWGNFFAVGGSWRISEESFLQNVSFVDNLKLRASYGEVGNDNLGDFYISQARYQLTSNAGNPAITLSDLGNAALTWETIESFDVALDFAVIDRIDGTVEYYRKNSSDLLYNLPIALSNGLNAIPDNVADMYNSGIEVSLTGRILDNLGGFTWEVTALGTTLKNEITKIPDPFQNDSKRWDVGRTRYDYYIYHSAGVDPDTGDQLYKVFEDDPETGNGVPVLDPEGNQETTTDWGDAGRAFTGDTSIPDFIGSITNRFSYKGFSLSVLFTTSQGGKLLDYGYSNMMSSGDFGESHHVDQLNAWKQPGDKTSVPRLENGNSDLVQRESTRFLTDASFWSLRNVNLSYTFNQQILDKLGLSKLGVFVSGENLWFKSERQGLNPQYNLAGTGSGNDYNPNRMISVGLNFGF